VRNAVTFVLSVAFAAAFWSTLPASADTIVQNVSGTQRAGTNLVLFNPSLGDLLSVQVEGTLSYNEEILRGSLTGDLPAVDVPLAVGFPLVLGLSGPDFADGTVSGDETYAAGSMFGSISLSGSLFALLTGVSVNPFIASNTTTVMIVPEIGPIPPTIGGTVFNPGSPLAGYSLKITYDYSPTGVPEPSTWAMMLLGFGAIGVAARRDRQIARA
jgi:hypothetical protein